MTPCDWCDAPARWVFIDADAWRSYACDWHRVKWGPTYGPTTAVEPFLRREYPTLVLFAVRPVQADPWPFLL